MIAICDVALIVARLLQDEDLEQKLLLDESEQSEPDFDLRTLAQCISLAVSEISGDGFPVCRKSTLAADASGTIVPDGFNGELMAVRSVKRDGVKVDYTFDSLGVHVPSAGQYEVEYIVSPEIAAVDVLLSDAVETGASVDKELIAYLALRNFCLILGRTDEAAIWDQRYIRESENKRLKRKSRLPAAKWR